MQFVRTVMALMACVLGFLYCDHVQAQRMVRVRSGDSWAKIARRHHISAWDLALANERTPNKALRAGEDLIVPSAYVTYVRPGQTLSHVARKASCSVDELRRLNRIKGNGVRAGKRLVLPGYDRGSERSGRDYGEPEQPGHVTLTVREDRATIRLLDDQGRVLESGLRELAEWMHRDPLDVTDESLPHPRLALLLARLSDHFGGRPIQLFSGFREARGRTKTTSRHVAGRAVDILVTGVPKRQLFEFCRSMDNTGCGYYPRSLFVHVDARKSPAQWVDWSRPGHRSLFGTLRRPYRRRERRNPNRPRETRRVTRPGLVPLQVEVVNAVGQAYLVDDTSEPDGSEAEVVQQRPIAVPRASVL